VEALSAQQRESGSWPSVPSRRIARTKLRRPWARSDSGKLFVDGACVFTTATVVSGLLDLRHAMDGASGEAEPRDSRAMAAVSQ
jgi:hypothetical protein